MASGLPLSPPRCARRERGFTLVEVTVVLAVVVTLALILSPSIGAFINDARLVRARADVGHLADAIAEFHRDTGFFPQWRAAGRGQPGTADERLDVLLGPGRAPHDPEASRWTTSDRTDAIANQLVLNRPAYRLKGRGRRLGWNGPYFATDLHPDPWGNRYMVNVGLLDLTPGAARAGGQPKLAVWALSPGPNGVIDTPYFQPITEALLGGDDVGVRIQ